MYHIEMLQCSCYGISNYRIRLRKSCSQLEKIVTLDLVSTDLEYCTASGHLLRIDQKVNAGLDDGDSVSGLNSWVLRAAVSSLDPVLLRTHPTEGSRSRGSSNHPRATTGSTPTATAPSDVG